MKLGAVRNPSMKVMTITPVLNVAVAVTGAIWPANHVT
jgi:hypothetical protein